MLFLHILEIIILDLLRESYSKCIPIQKSLQPPSHGGSRNFSVAIEARHNYRLQAMLALLLKIYLNEVLDYPNVVLVDAPISEGLQNNCNRPEVAGAAAQGGAAGRFALREGTLPSQPSARSRESWFAPAYLEERPIRNHWRTFQNLEDASFFHVNLSEYRDHLLEGGRRYDCEEQSGCKQGIYSPRHCPQTLNAGSNATEVSCGTLLARFPSECSFLVEFVSKHQLYVEIAYLGVALETVVERLLRRRLIFALFTRSTNPVLGYGDDSRFVSISMPPCSLPSRVECLFGHRSIHKLVSPEIKRVAPDVYQAVTNMKIDAQMMRSLGSLLSSQEQNLEDAACRFYATNSNWKAWYPKRSTVEIYIGGIFPITSWIFGGSGVVLAAQMAVEAVNSNRNILKQYTLKLLIVDGHCRTDMVLKSFIDFVLLEKFKSMVGILGPACSDTVEPIASVSKHYSTIVMSYSAEASSYSDREKYPYFFRTIGENKQFKFVYFLFLQKMEWKRVAAITEEGKKIPEYIPSLRDMLQLHNISFVTHRKIPTDRTSSNMSQYLDDLIDKRARIIIADVHEDVANALMCEAYKKHMTGKEGFVWFLPSWFSHRSNLKLPCSEEDIRKASEGAFVLSHSYFSNNHTIMQENIMVKQWLEKYVETMQKRNRLHEEFSMYAGYVYDAVWTYAYALDKLVKDAPERLEDLHTKDTAQELSRLISDTDFQGLSGRIQFFGASRVGKVDVFQIRGMVFHQIGTFYPNATCKHSGRLILNISAIVWQTADRQPPSDGTDHRSICVLEKFSKILKLTCEETLVIANILGFCLFAVVLISCFVILKRRYEKKVQMTEERIKNLGFRSSYNISCLKEWEIPKERIVLNRKLGEGAFGNVYGGEAFFNEKGWIAVAVKTLKIGSTLEEKLDFLSEAEIMKRFDHKNIVKLMGVCTTHEPVYTVMEFMLYGDLKTYLLARRHLVSEKNHEENEEVSCRRLTMFCLDIARALSYLADLKYVHRDVACRNCLINANRIAKLADFGMTRPVHEKDYYKFSRKGMLPVRWMAPESLADGKFTPMTDIWSYGVLLYEVVTFGNFPFQGLSNTQVLEYVKSGYTISFSKEIKPQLKTLMKSCWNRCPTKRPQASEIVELLVNTPKLITPCPETPVSFAEFEETESMLHPNRLGKHTGGSGKKKNRDPSSSCSLRKHSNTGHLVEPADSYITNVNLDLPKRNASYKNVCFQKKSNSLFSSASNPRDAVLKLNNQVYS